MMQLAVRCIMRQPAPCVQMLPFPDINPIALAIGPLEIRWYALSYLAGILGGWWLALRYARQLPARVGWPTPQDFDDFVTWAVLGIVLGGRLGFVLFYQFGHYLANPLEILMLWRGGMSFHGGMLGFILAMLLFCRRRRLRLLPLADGLCAVVPLGLMLGRVANFINGELYGRVTSVPWAMVFPHSDGQPRHPSQLYHAALEGALLLALLQWLAHQGWARERPGLISAAFLLGYGLCRSVVEFFREPDPQLGFLWGGLTMGQILCLPMLMGGLGLGWWVWQQHRSRPS